MWTLIKQSSARIDEITQPLTQQMLNRARCK
jgi:hypothetical protein